MFQKHKDWDFYLLLLRFYLRVSAHVSEAQGLGPSNSHRSGILADHVSAHVSEAQGLGLETDVLIAKFKAMFQPMFQKHKDWDSEADIDQDKTAQRFSPCFRSTRIGTFPCKENQRPA